MTNGSNHWKLRQPGDLSQMAVIIGYYIHYWIIGLLDIIYTICHKSPALGKVYKSPSAYRVLSHALTVILYLFLLKPEVFHLGWI